MKITLNNRPEEIPFESLSIQELINYKNFSFKLLVTKINDKLVKKEVRTSAMIEEGDDVTVLHLISGG